MFVRTAFRLNPEDTLQSNTSTRDLDELVAAVARVRRGPMPNLTGKKMYPRADSRLKRPGKIIGYHAPRISVRWPSGKLTYPLLAACFHRQDGDWQIR